MPKFDAILNYSIKDIKLKTKKDSYLSNCLSYAVRDSNPGPID